MRSVDGPELPAPEPRGVSAGRRVATRPRPSRWTPAVLLSAGLLAVMGLEAASGDAGLSADPAPTTSAPESSMPDPSVPDSAAPSTTVVPDPSTTAPVTSEPATSEPETSEPPSTDPGDGAPTTTMPSDPAPETTVPTPTTVPDTEPTTSIPETDEHDHVGGETPVVPSVPQGGWPVRIIRFPVAGVVSYSDDWGDCRGGTSCPRSHIGNDLIGSRLQPLLAATDGVVTHFVDDHPTAGWGVVITDAEGWTYRYYHVNNDTPGTDDGEDDGEWRFPTGIAMGATVKAGQVIAFMGDSGNSETSVPHVHFEIHTPSGTPVNPYQSLRAAELLDRCANTGDPMANALFPVRQPASATQTVLTKTGKGWFLIGRDGAFVPSGDATYVGDPNHGANGFTCGSGAIVALGSICSDTSAILATIRQMESGGNYQARAAKASASGAYQFIDSTWNRFGGFTSAWQAPPEVQDARALLDVQKFLDRYGDVAMIPVAWYWPRALSHPEDMDAVPRPDAGNRLTVRQYQQRWLAEYAAHRASSNGLCPG